MLTETQKASKQLWLYLAYDHNRCCGLLVNEEGAKNAIWFLHVVSDRRREGIGSALFNAALCNVSGNWTAGLGSGYWWQGVPEGCGEDFLGKRGFSWSWTSVDMLLPLRSWTHNGNSQNQEKEYVIEQLTLSDASALISILSEEPDLAAWVDYYKQMIQDAQCHRILVCKLDREIAGCAMILDEADIRWSSSFPGRTGGIGCLGVANRYRNKGIGLALAAAVTKELQSLGFDFSYIGYTWLEDWYGKLGYHTICRQKMGERLQVTPYLHLLGLR